MIQNPYYSPEFHGDYEIASIGRLDLMLSGLQLQTGDGRWVGPAGWHGHFRAALPDRHEPLPGLAPGRYRALRFAIGVAPEANHADPNRLAPGDPLHPLVNDMHWGWTGGWTTPIARPSASW